MAGEPPSARTITPGSVGFGAMTVMPAGSVPMTMIAFFSSTQSVCSLSASMMRFCFSWKEARSPIHTPALDLESTTSA